MAELVQYKCPYCALEVRGNSYFKHARACEKRPRGPTKKLYPIELPQDVHRQFLSKCRGLGMTLAQRVWLLIEQDIRTQED